MDPVTLTLNVDQLTLLLHAVEKLDADVRERQIRISESKYVGEAYDQLVELRVGYMRKGCEALLDIIPKSIPAIHAQAIARFCALKKAFIDAKHPSEEQDRAMKEWTDFTLGAEGVLPNFELKKQELQWNTGHLEEGWQPK